MKKIFVFLILSFFLTGECLAEKSLQLESGEKTSLSMIIDKYEKEGYKIIAGPLQYLERGKGFIRVYRHKPISFRSMDILNERGENSLLLRYDFIYILKKNSKIIAVKIKRRESDNV
ncbi:MAG: hypothetical protein CSA18_02335 [Deltaproteobacteria bacterium]|nr:MAG: hypothetical protein CSB21_01130 [Deltaproteobacteria bacterium]PIE74969.1 MAG: hypothetical protein CSA18_02335 [Deltaproteobacteria bacterium]